MTAGARGFGLSCFGVRLVVVGDSEDAVEAVDRYVLPSLPRVAIDDATADRVVEIRHAGDGAGFEVLVDGTIAGTAPSPLAAIPAVQRALDEAVLKGQRNVAMIHGGVVVHRGRAILLPGPTLSGKSTLVAELVRRGAPYSSDEYALVDADGWVHPYPRALLLRDASGVARPTLAADLGGSVAHCSVPASLVLALRYVEDAALTLEPLSQAEGVLLLLRNTPQVLADQPWILAPLERAVQTARCYIGQRGEARDAVDAILDLAGSMPQEGAAPVDADRGS